MDGRSWDVRCVSFRHEEPHVRNSAHKMCATMNETLGTRGRSGGPRSDIGLTGWPPQPARPVVLAGISAQSPLARNLTSHHQLLQHFSEFVFC